MKRTISKSERPYKLLLCVMISLLVIMLAGCSTSSDSDTNTRGFTDFATIEEEYLTTIESLNWPEGVTLPDALEGEDTGASFQIGYGDTRASNLWEYSWMQEWLDTYNTDSERAAKALAELEKPLICLIWEQIAVMTPHANIFVIILIKLSWEIRLDLQSVFRQIMPIKNGT